jgi:ABC-type Fe3+-hydroxamate transport system substrate-binding protein
MKNKILAILAVAILFAAGVGVIVLTRDNNNTKASGPQTVVDGAGRNVTVPTSLEHGIVTLGGVDPLRFISYLGAGDSVIEVDKGDVTDPKNGRGYSYAYNYTGLPYHPDNALSGEDTERIGNLQPSLIVVGSNVYSAAKANVDLLAQTTSVVVLYSFSSTSPFWDANYKLNSTFSAQIVLLGKLLHRETRASQLISGIEGLFQDIRSNVGTSSIKSYVAGVTFQGSNPLDYTFPFYAPLVLINGTNVYTTPGTLARVQINVETFPVLDPDVVLIDPSSSDKLSDANSQLVMKYIFGVNNDTDASNDIRMYSVIPIVWDGTNWDCAVAASYYLEHIIYGKFTMEEVRSKITAAFQVFYGSNGTGVLDSMSQFFVSKSTNNGVELPLLGEVKVTYEGGKYLFKRA